MNRVRLYSNGTAIISREYPFPNQEPVRISIPVRKTDLDDVVSSLAVFGNVRITEPPTYTPTNADEAVFDINPVAALRDLGLKLAGAAVEIDAGASYKGTLVGLHQYTQEVDGTTIERYRFVVLTEQGIQQVDNLAATAIRFTDPLVQTEVERALRARLGKIKPDSSKVELTVRPHPDETCATICYATPVAAWKIRYQIRLDADGAELDGQAIVDNDTDDDWAETIITVITGEPITFSTDLAEVRRPARSRVNIVAEHTIGAVTAEPELLGAQSDEQGGYGGYGGGGYGGGGGGYGGGGASSRRSRAVAASAPQPRAIPDLTRAEQTEAETRESGDFSIFTSPEPVNLGAGRSAIIPLFQTPLGAARSILLYQERGDPVRPFRAIRFQNQAPHTLGRGVCEVFVAGEFQGKCVLEATKAGAEALLIHAKETGVRVHKHANRPETRRLAIRITEGTVVHEVLHRVKTSYRVQNSHAEAFVLEVDHSRTMADSDLAVTLSAGVPEVVDIPSGQRIRVTLPATGALEIQVLEQQVEAKQFGVSVAWLVGNVIGLQAPAARENGIQECIDLQGQVDAIERQIREQGETVGSLTEEQERLIKLIPNGHTEQANAWRTDLATAEAELRAIKRTTLPQLRIRMKEAQDALHQALRTLQYAWKGDDPR